MQMTLRHSPPEVTGASLCHFPPQSAAKAGDFLPGDFILTHGSTFYGRLIRFGQYLRFRGPDRKYAWWNHTALIVSESGDLIEAFGTDGVVSTNIASYAPTDYTLVQLGSLARPGDREQVVAYARWALGQRYGWITIVSIALNLLTGGKVNFGIDGQSICSGLVARALERTSAIFDRSPSHTMPADLARYYKVDPPPPGSPIGRVPDTPSRERAH